jgi:hypothetical protein
MLLKTSTISLIFIIEILKDHTSLKYWLLKEKKQPFKLTMLPKRLVLNLEVVKTQLILLKKLLMKDKRMQDW